MPPPPAPLRARGERESTRWSWTAAWVLLLAAFLALRVDLATEESSMDERIVLSVSKGMSETGRLDPNWTVASPHYYRYPQYNFYSYNVLSHFLIVATAPLPAEPIVVLRIANVVYQLAALGLLIAVLRKLRFPPAALFAAAALITFLPGMVHDAHIARCESLLYLLFAGVMASAVAGRFLVGGLILGFGAAAKVTFLAAGLVFVPCLYAAATSLPVLLRRTATIGLASIVAFALSAPYAVLHFPVLVAGLARIHGVYVAHGAGPHRLLDPTPLRDALHAAAFLGVVYGSLVPAAIVAPLFNRAPFCWSRILFQPGFARQSAKPNDQPCQWLRAGGKPVPGFRDHALFLGVWLATLAVIVYFAPAPFFIERNYSLAVFGCAALLGAWLTSGVARPLARIAFAAALLPMAYWSLQIALASAERPAARRAQWEAAHIDAPVTFFWTGERDAAVELPNCSGLLAIPDLNDDFSRHLLAHVRATGRREVARYVSRFSMVPTSTLHTYLDADVDYFTCAP
jgi:hypothetical protein